MCKAQLAAISFQPVALKNHEKHNGAARIEVQVPRLNGGTVSITFINSLTKRCFGTLIEFLLRFSLAFVSGHVD
jgi:hypothetical protein